MPLLCFVPHLSTGVVGTCYAQVQRLPLLTVTTLARISGLYLGGRRFPYVSPRLPSWRLNVRYKPGHISKRRLLEEASRDGRVVLKMVAKNISAFGVMTSCILVDGTGVSPEIAVPSLTAPSRMLQWYVLNGWFYHFIINHQTMIISHMFTVFTIPLNRLHNFVPSTLTHGRLMLSLRHALVFSSTYTKKCSWALYCRHV